MTAPFPFARIICNPRLMLLVMAALSAFALGMAYIAQFGFGLAPCILCLYQRVPFAVAIALGIGGYALNKSPRAFLSVICITLAFNAVIAFYHSGVERKWWRSFIEGCSTPDLSGSIDDLMARIEAAPVTVCSDIPWADPVLGGSMANYNVVFCLILAAIAGFSALKK